MISLKRTIKRFLPITLLGRALLIIFLPLLLLQVILVWVFFDRHIDRVTWQLSRSLAGEITHILTELEQRPNDIERILELAQSAYQYEEISIEQSAILPNETSNDQGFVAEMLSQALSQLRKPFQIDSSQFRERIQINIQLADSVLKIVVSGKRLFSVTIIIFILWMIGSSIILFAIASVFMRNQVRPLMKLAKAVDAFGKGQEEGELNAFKLEGSLEVRQAALAFNRMRERIKRQIRQRTDMLSGVSHDLRTPLTRMILQTEFMEDEEIKKEFQLNLHEMQDMIAAYLAFARGEGNEERKQVRLDLLIARLSQSLESAAVKFDCHVEGQLEIFARPLALRRLLDNLISNACRYAKTIRLQVALRSEAGLTINEQPLIEFLIDDDGPGIPEEQREAAFQPFMRLDPSRNPATGGTGLGLTIAQDIVNSHGGRIWLEDSPLGGLRVRIRLPK